MSKHNLFWPPNFAEKGLRSRWTVALVPLYFLCWYRSARKTHGLQNVSFYEASYGFVKFSSVAPRSSVHRCSTSQVFLELNPWIYAFQPKRHENVCSDSLENVCLKLAGYFPVNKWDSLLMCCEVDVSRCWKGTTNGALPGYAALILCFNSTLWKEKLFENSHGSVAMPLLTSFSQHHSTLGFLLGGTRNQ